MTLECHRDISRLDPNSLFNHYYIMTDLNNSLNAQPTPLTSPAPATSRPPSMKRVMWAGAVVLVLVVAALIGWWNLPPELHGIQLQSPRVADDFTLETSTGEPMSLSDFRGKYVVLFFGYTYCPDVCPTTLNDLQQMVKELGEKRAENVQIIMVSVDPERDTPEQLAQYLAFFNPNFIGMTGTVEDIQPVASQFGIYFERHEGSADTGYLVDHTAAVTVIDPEGYVRMIFTNGVKGADMASDIAYLMRRG
jgi:protein SCO1/2